MRDGILFEITRDSLETGLRGVPVGYCVTSLVDPMKGLSYVGRPIQELSLHEPIEVIYLLYYGEKGDKDQIKIFEKELIKRAHCSKETIEAIEGLPTCGDPMDLLASSILVASFFEKTKDYKEDCLNLIAKLPSITAAVINTHAKWGKTPQAKPELGYVENFLHMLNMKGEKTDELLNVMKLFNVLHYDHCGGNLSTFVGKSVASGLTHMYGSIAASILALSGPRHGRANQDCLEFVKKAIDELGDDPNPKDVETLIREKLKKGELIYGFGHAVLRVEDPRATVCYSYCNQHFASNPLVKMALLLREEATKVLKEDPKIANPYPNIDAITGAMLSAAGFPFSEYYPCLFGLSRVVGIAIQIVYERLEARNGKGTPIMRPLYFYKARK